MAGLTGLAVSRDGGGAGTTAKGFRHAVAGLLSTNSSTPTDVRTGVLYDGGVNVVAGAASWNYAIRAHRAVIMPTASQGPIIVANDAVLNVATGAAPGANSRYDVIWVRQHLVAADGGGDPDVICEYGVTQGSVAASPSVPAIPSGAMELARALVTAGNANTNAVTITQTHRWTAPNGSPIPVRGTTERGALTPYDGMMIHRLDTHRVERHNGTDWKVLDEVDVVTPQPINVTGGSAPAYNTGWSNAVDGSFYSRSGDWVELTVFAQKSSFAAGEVLFTLLPGFRPDRVVRWNGLSGAAATRLGRILPNGDVIVDIASTGNFFFHQVFQRP